MRVLIIGASSPQSIGFQIGEMLRATDHEILYASRREKWQENISFQSCDATKAREVAKLFKAFLPEMVIYAAGVFSNTQSLGAINDWSMPRAHIEAKTIGALAVLDAAVRIGTVKRVIFLGGREVSAHDGFAAYTCANAAMWGLVKFATKHVRQFSTHYIDLSMVEGSTMANLYLSDPARKKSTDGAISIDVLTEVIQAILAGKCAAGERIILGQEWNI